MSASHSLDSHVNPTMFPSIPSNYTEDDVERIQNVREERALLIDTMLEEADVESESSTATQGERCSSPQ